MRSVFFFFFIRKKLDNRTKMNHMQQPADLSKKLFCFVWHFGGSGGIINVRSPMDESTQRQMASGAMRVL